MPTDDAPQHETVLVTGARARLARVYAEALLAAADKDGRGEAVGEELQAVASGVFTGHPEVATFLSSPAVTGKARLPLLAEAFGGSSDLFKKFVGVLNSNNRLALVGDVAAAYRDMLDKRAGRVRVVVRSAVPLDDAQQDGLRRTLAAALNQQPVLSVRVEPELLGGLVVQVGDRVYDTSVRTRLDSLRTHLMASASHGV